MNQTIEALIDKAINETASQEELLKLEEHLLSDSLVRERYLHAVNMHAVNAAAASRHPTLSASLAPLKHQSTFWFVWVR